MILLFFFIVMPRLNKMHFKLPMVAGFLGFFISQWVLISAPVNGYGYLLFNAFLEACSFAAVSPLVDRMIVLTIDPKERARILSILYVGVILISSPFGWIAGTLSTINKDLPFILNIVLFAAGTALAYQTGQDSQKRLAAEAAVV